MMPLQQFASFVLAHRLDDITSIYLSRARATKLPLLKSFTHLSEEELLSFVKQNFSELLKSIVAGKSKEYALQSIALWADDKFPGIKRDQAGLYDFVQFISIRKYSFIKVLPAYTQDIEQHSAIVLALDEYYDFCRNKIYEAFIHSQNEALRREKDFIELVMNTTQEGIWAVDEDLRVMLWNKAIAERTNIKKKDILGQPLLDFFPENVTKVEVEALQKVQQGEKVYLENIAIKSSKGFYDVNVLPLKDQKGAIIGSLAFSRDVTEKKMAMDELAAANEELTAQQAELQSLNAELEQKIMELEEAQKELQENQHFIENIANASPDFITVYNLKEKKNKYANKGVAEYLGYDLKEAREGGFAFMQKIIHPDDIQRVSRFIQEYLTYAEDAPRALEYRIKDAKGDYRWIAANYKLFRKDVQGNPLEVVGISRDITEKKQQEKALQKANEELVAALEELKSTEEQLIALNNELEKRIEERTKELAANEEELRQSLDKTIELNETLVQRENFLSSIIDQTPISTWIADAEGTLIQANKACMELFGVADASLGVGKYNILKDELLIGQPFYKDIQAVFSEGKVTKFSGWYNLSKVKHVHIPVSKKVYLIATVFPIKNTNGEVTHAVIQHEDITERVRSEQALRKSEEQLRMITDALPVLISYINTGHIYTFVNKAYTTWFGKTKEEILGKPAWEVIGESAFENAKDKIEKVLSGEEVRFEAHMPYKFGEARDTMTHLVPHKEAGNVVGYFVLVTDISSLRSVQAELTKKNNELIRINTDLDNFIYTASHDLKSPIVNMEGIVIMMERTLKAKLSEKEQKFLDMMEISIGKLKDTINCLSDITKIAKNLDQQAEEVMVAEVVADVKSDIHHFIMQVKPTIEEHYEVEQMGIGKANFRSIVYNLLSNAIKYRSSERALQVCVSTYEEGEYYVFAVKDNGLGLSVAQQSKLFTMFKRLHTHVEGTGIGLYIIKRIVENLHGKVVVESELNQGSTFKVFFPKPDR